VTRLGDDDWGRDLQARTSVQFQGYVAKNNLNELSIGKPGEEFRRLSLPTW
jgi:hypothetical protein